MNIARVLRRFRKTDVGVAERGRAALLTAGLELRRHVAPPPILVYQMGKVASQALAESLRAAGVRRPVHHVHWISEQGRREYRQLSVAGGRHRMGRHYWIGEHLADLVAAGQLPRCDVITLVRDPIARNVSAFFHARDLFLSAAREHATADDLRELFLRDFPHQLPLTWFDKEFVPIFDVDVYAHEFQRDRGFTIIESPKARILLMRLEDLNRCAQPALSTFLNLPSFALKRENAADQKSYGTAYGDFIKGLRLPADYLDQMYSSKYSRHFYSAAELSAFRKKWG